ALDESQPAVQRVADFFTDLDVEVIDMTDHLRGIDPRQLIVNSFDSHPGVSTQYLTADVLTAAIQSTPVVSDAAG
ncbi:MAG: hypothetical protein GYB67_18850, partial [Chloroflexi bacterium]|nr:hypothetical protein [Chloroflexota bacterium]